MLKDGQEKELKAICVDRPLSKRICSAGQSSGEDLFMGFCINFKIPAVLC